MHKESKPYSFTKPLLSTVKYQALSFFAVLLLKVRGDFTCKIYFQNYLLALKSSYFIYLMTDGFWLHWVFLPVRVFLQLPRVQATLWLWRTGFPLRWLFLQWSVGFRVLGLLWLQHRGSIVAVFRLQSTGSAVVTQGLSCSTVCGIFPDQGLNPMFPTLAGRFFTTESPVKPCFKILNKSLCKVMLQPFASFS